MHAENISPALHFYHLVDMNTSLQKRKARGVAAARAEHKRWGIRLRAQKQKPSCPLFALVVLFLIFFFLQKVELNSVNWKAKLAIWLQYLNWTVLRAAPELLKYQCGYRAHLRAGETFQQKTAIAGRGM